MKQHTRKNYYAMFRVAKQQTGMDDDSYRALLARCGAQEKGGKVSATTMTMRQLEHALQEFKRCGFKPKAAVKKTAGKAQNLDALINTLWQTLYDNGATRTPSQAALWTWLRNSKITRADRREWMTDAERMNAVERLKNWAGRYADKGAA